ncbi:stonustoxin subunit alpha-like [Ambystoma mexicanum]|uniref:stonustoxin subunit alpha-like n=1 Tax=Ambystoma mexicanum TaxID=8296 RepID=UPI0037E777A6
MATSDPTAIEMPALGRPFQLGMLYDCRSDKLIPGITLWDNETLQTNVSTDPQTNTAFRVITSDTIEEKASSLSVSASLKASLLSGLVEVNGSASYLNDRKTSKKQARVSLQYSTTTKFQQLTMKHLGRQNVSYPDVFDQGTATHVVTAVLYGAQAFFVFDQELSSTERNQDIQGNLDLMIKKIPMIAIEGEGSLDMKGENVEGAEKFSCTFHGDFSIESNPTTYQEAIKMYSTLPKLLGERGENAVPMKVWLYPLKQLDSKAAQVVRDISIQRVFDAQAVIEKMTGFKMQFNDLMKHPAVTCFPEMIRDIEWFQEQCSQYTLTFQKQLAEILPSIRGGEVEEGVLVDILASCGKSPFNSQALAEFLEHKQQEMDLVNSYLTFLKDVRVLTSASDLDLLVLDPTAEYVMAFTFTSLKEEPFLSELREWLQSRHTKTNDPTAQNPTCKKENLQPWFRQTDISKKTRKYVKAFKDFSTLNKSSEVTQFIVSSLPDADNPGASVYLYGAGELLSTAFEPPSKPRPPLIGSVTHDSVELTFRPDEFGQEAIDMYKIEYMAVGDQECTDISTTQKMERFTIKGLYPNSEYKFRYYAVCKPGLSAASEFTRAAKTLPISPPEKPASFTLHPQNITLTWNPPSVIADGVTITDYKVEYRLKAQNAGQVETGGWFEKKVGGKVEKIEVGGLQANTCYGFRVYAICKDAYISAPSEEVDILTPDNQHRNRIAHTLLAQSTLETEGSPSIYALPTVLVQDGVHRKHTMGKEIQHKTPKVIMVLGATGSGKTTLINGMVNYILGVDWEDDFRFKLIQEVLHKSQAHSQTSEVTAYEIHEDVGFQIPYPLTIIDTPGFGDTRGIEQDKRITQMIREFFSKPGGIDHIDAVCCVVQASSARLTHSQKYVFDSVLSIFGKDIEDNIQILITFADGQAPPVLDAIKAADIPCAKDSEGMPVHFKFNNSALFASNLGTEEANTFNFNGMFWKMGTSSMETFFRSLTHLEPKSLNLTKEVLKERNELEAAVQGLQPQIKAGLMKLEELRKTQHALEQHKDDMNANKDFEYEVDITYQVKENITGFITNCNYCHYTCHYPCYIGDDKKKSGCSAMQNGNCRVCPGLCAWNVHFNQAYKFDFKTKKERKTYSDLKDRYEKASGQVMSAENMFDVLVTEYSAVEERVMHLIERSSASLRRLQEIALKPNPLGTPEHIDLMIQAEEMELKEGYQERIRSLREVREQAVLISKIANNEELLPEEREKYNSMKQPPSKMKTFITETYKSLKSFF